MPSLVRLGHRFLNLDRATVITTESAGTARVAFTPNPASDAVFAGPEAQALLAYLAGQAPDLLAPAAPTRPVTEDQEACAHIPARRLVRLAACPDPDGHVWTADWVADTLPYHVYCAACGVEPGVDSEREAIARWGGRLWGRR